MSKRRSDENKISDALKRIDEDIKIINAYMAHQLRCDPRYISALLVELCRDQRALDQLSYKRRDLKIIVTQYSVLLELRKALKNALH